MDDQIVTVTYLKEPGPQNTELTLAAAKARALALGLRHVVVATDTGRTARRALEVFGDGFQVVAVTSPEQLRLPIDRLHDYTERFRRHREELRERGVESIPVGMSEVALDGLRVAGVLASRIDWERFNKFVRRDVNSLDVIGAATRVALSCTVWAFLERHVPPDVEVVALAGTGFGGGGADTALVLRTAKLWKGFRVLETIVRPRVGPPSLTQK